MRTKKQKQLKDEISLVLNSANPYLFH